MLVMFRLQTPYYLKPLHFSEDLVDYNYSEVTFPEGATEFATFNCIFNLAPQESAEISVALYLNIR